MKSLEIALLKPLMDELNEKFSAKLREKVDFYAGSMTTIVRAIERLYGKEGVMKVKKAWMDWNAKEWKKRAREGNDFSKFISLLESDCVGVTDWERVVDKPLYKGYKFSRCMWAESFRKLKAEDVGKWLCESDNVFPKAFNEDIRFKRTKTLMNGDDYCDHVFWIEPKR